MFNNYFYNETIKRYIAIFGIIFKGMNIKNHKTDSLEKVHINYGPRSKFIDRAKENDLSNKKLSMKLPRMSYQMDSPAFDGERKLNKFHKQVVSSNVNGVSYYYTPSPYTFPFTLSVAAKNLDDIYQIIEQILPYFEPNITFKIKPMKDNLFETDANVILNGVAIEDNYDNDINSNRLIIATLDFEMKAYLFKSINNADVIKKTRTDIDIHNVNTSVEHTVDPFTATEDDIYEIITQIDDGEGA